MRVRSKVENKTPSSRKVRMIGCGLAMVSMLLGCLVLVLGVPKNETSVMVWGLNSWVDLWRLN
jgi:hypothetical protein